MSKVITNDYNGSYMVIYTDLCETEIRMLDIWDISLFSTTFL